MKPFSAATGQNIAFLQVDINWGHANWPQSLRQIVSFAQAGHLPLGIIYNANTTAAVSSDHAWLNSAVQNMIEIESKMGIVPAQAVFDSWDRFPRRSITDETGLGEDYLVKQYLRASPSLRLSRSGQDITGTLSGRDGEPIAGAAITLTATDVGGRLSPTARHLAGTVPERAAFAVVGIRIGLEGACVCAGPTAALVGGIHYRERGKPPQDISPVNPPVQGASVHTLPVTPGKIFAPNLKQFAVTPGAAYTLDTSLSAPAAADHAGYVTVIFLDAAGKGMSRENLWFTPSVQPLGRAMTDARGAFSLRLPANVASARPEIRAEWAGSASLRPAMAILPLSTQAYPR
jgi:hypothetical protein